MLLSVVLLLVLLATLHWLWMRRTISPYHFPPLVPGFFHLFQADLPSHLQSLAQRYGPLYRVHLGMQDVVVLNSKKAIEEALTKNWLDFSGRPQTFTNQEVSKNSHDLSLGDYTPLWKAQRKLARSALLYVQNTMEPIIGQMVQDLCKRLLAQAGSPVSIHKELSMFTGSIISFLSFGEKRESVIQQFYSCIQELMVVWDSWQIQILDVLPILRVFPNSGLRKLRRLVKKRDRIVQEQLSRHKETMVEGQIRDLTDYMLQKLREQAEGPNRLSEEHVHMALVDIFIGGMETMSSTLTWALAFLLHHPEIQRRLQEELDEELDSGSPGSLPNYRDRDRFPLLNATITEVLRLRPAAPLALPHYTRQPSTICGFDIPKNTIVIPNIYGAHHDDRIWEQPYDFRPDRFLESEPSQAGIPFSCGVRVCLGETMARFELFLILAQLLWTFKLLPVEGNASLPSLKPEFGAFMLKAPNFLVRLLPRRQELE
ncbi:steroid 21-hydroxylase isoform X2 [Monodelphis domestica]|uniref:steroid 21-hydroxylase isoform X2 n=1 Tax=Monodelphis domestica TaxID=13616 RepID=UPI0024E22FB5|nr:steroid 21-hydroxylase isoform X2 [Monodelphis domestica]